MALRQLEDVTMARKRGTADEIVAKLRQVDVLTAQGRSVRSAGRAATGPSDARIDRQIAASSIQTGISWMRSAAASTRPHRADTPVVRSITSRTCTNRPAHGCQA